MKKLIILIMLAATAAFAQTPQQLMEKGNDAYNKGDYAAAAEAYEAILRGGQHSADLYYNLGNAYYRQEEIGLAILNYERSLLLNPHFRDAEQNLELAYSKTEDEITPLPKIFLAKWAEAVVSWFSPNGWLVLLLILAAVLGALVVVFFTSNDYQWRKNALLSGLLVTLLLVMSLACTISSFNHFNRHDEAIVTSPMIVVKSSPESHSVDKMILHEGTKVKIEETLGEWFKIEIADGNNGWVESSEVTTI